MRINSPHYLCKIKLGEQNDSKYTLVISQYEKTNTIYYTLRAYGTCPFILRKIPQLYKYEKEVYIINIFLDSLNNLNYTFLNLHINLHIISLDHRSMEGYYSRRM